MLCATTQTVERCLQEAIAEDHERRQLHRKPFFRPATIEFPTESQAAVSAYCRDISQSGIGLLHKSPLEPGSHFTLTIPLLGRSLELYCESSWCTCAGANQYVSGCAYQCVSTPQSFVLISAVLGEQLNRRLQRRYCYFRTATLEDVHGDYVSAFCRDISRQGIGFVHRDPIKLGRTVVNIHSPDGEDAVAVADIRRCLTNGNGWYSSGGKFLIDASR